MGRTALNVNKLFTLLFNSEASLYTRSKILRTISHTSKRVHFKDLIFTEHANHKIVPGLLEECLVYFLNGYGMSIIKVANEEYPYEVLRLARNRGEVNEKRLYNFKSYDKRCRNEEEVEQLLAECQDKTQPTTTTAKCLAAINYLDTIDSYR